MPLWDTRLLEQELVCECWSIPHIRRDSTLIIVTSKIILVPEWVGKICLLLGDDLSRTELGNCTKITGRTYNTFLTGIDNVSRITGANTLDIASIGIDGSLVSSNVTQLQDAFDRCASLS